MLRRGGQEENGTHQRVLSGMHLGKPPGPTSMAQLPCAWQDRNACAAAPALRQPWAAQASRLRPLSSLAIVTTPFSMDQVSLQMRSTKSVFGSIMTMPPRKFVSALARASTVSTSR